MEQKSLSNWLKLIIIGTGICGIIVYAYLIPVIGNDMVAQYPEFSNCYYPWLILIWLTAIPCYIVLVFAYQIATNIGKDKSFCNANAAKLKYISMLALGDVVFLFVMNVVYLVLNMNHPGILLAALFIVFVGIAVSVTAAALSHLVQKAAILQEQSDLTI